MDEWQVRSQPCFQAYSIEAPAEKLQCAFDHAVNFAGPRLGGREARQCRKLIYQLTHGFNRTCDGGGAAQHHRNGTFVRRNPAFQMTADALRRKSYRRQRVLDFMRDSPGDLAPCGLLLRAQQLGKVLENHYVAESLALNPQRSNGHRDVQLLAA